MGMAVVTRADWLKPCHVCGAWGSHSCVVTDGEVVREFQRAYQTAAPVESCRVELPEMGVDPAAPFLYAVVVGSTTR